MWRSRPSGKLQLPCLFQNISFHALSILKRVEQIQTAVFPCAQFTVVKPPVGAVWEELSFIEGGIDFSTGVVFTHLDRTCLRANQPGTGADTPPLRDRRWRLPDSRTSPCSPGRSSLCHILGAKQRKTTFNDTGQIWTIGSQAFSSAGSHVPLWGRPLTILARLALVAGLADTGPVAPVAVQGVGLNALAFLRAAWAICPLWTCWREEAAHRYS